jgi:hypothetical protein
LPIIGVLALVGLGISLSQPGQTTGSVLEIMLEALAGFVGAMIQALGSLTLVFAILERTLPNLEEQSKEWDPRTLSKVEAPDRVTFSGPVFEIVFNLALLALLNFYSRSLGLGYASDGGWGFGFVGGEGWVVMPVLSESFYRFLPALNVAFVAEIVLNLILLRQGAWKPLTRWLSIGVHIFWIVVLVAMLAFDPQVLSGAGPFTPEAAATLVMVLNQLLRSGLAVVLV